MGKKAYYLMLMSLYRDEYLKFYLTRDMEYFVFALSFLQAASSYRSMHSISGLS
ncbi:MAG: hypothetical protein U0W24_00675 [Bacteroidales bacterium]